MQGDGEYPLSIQGIEQAQSAREGLSQLNAAVIASSDLSRALETAHFASGRVDIIDQRLRERGAGPWEGKTREEIEKEFPGSLENDLLRPEGFEELASVIARLSEVSEYLLSLNETVIAYTHGAVLRVFEAHLLNQEPKRFKNLEALVLGPGLEVIGRSGPFLKEGLVK